MDWLVGGRLIDGKGEGKGIELGWKSRRKLRALFVMFVLSVCLFCFGDLLMQMEVMLWYV